MKKKSFTASQSSMRSTGISFDGLLHYDAVFNKKHHVTGLLGYEYYQRDNNYFRAENSGFGTDATHENNLGGGNAPKIFQNVRCYVNNMRHKAPPFTGLASLSTHSIARVKRPKYPFRRS